MSKVTLPVLAIAVLLAADAIWLDSQGAIYVARDLDRLIDWLAFWR
jgi:hypothetical protein